MDKMDARMSSDVEYQTKEGQALKDMKHKDVAQGWRSGESTRLPPMWPGFESQIRFPDPASYGG